MTLVLRFPEHSGHLECTLQRLRWRVHFKALQQLNEHHFENGFVLDNRAVPGVEKGVDQLC